MRLIRSVPSSFCHGIRYYFYRSGDVTMMVWATWSASIHAGTVQCSSFCHGIRYYFCRSGDVTMMVWEMWSASIHTGIMQCSRTESTNCSLFQLFFFFFPPRPWARSFRRSWWTVTRRSSSWLPAWARRTWSCRPWRRAWTPPRSSTGRPCKPCARCWRRRTRPLRSVVGFVLHLRALGIVVVFK